MRNTNSDDELPAFLMEAQATNNASYQQEPSGPPPTQPKKSKRRIEKEQLQKIARSMSRDNANYWLGWVNSMLIDVSKKDTAKEFQTFLACVLKAGRTL